jgi:hypothetical protein
MPSCVEIVQILAPRRLRGSRAPCHMPSVCPRIRGKRDRRQNALDFWSQGNFHLWARTDSWSSEPQVVGLMEKVRTQFFSLRHCGRFALVRTGNPNSLFGLWNSLFSPGGLGWRSLDHLGRFGVWTRRLEASLRVKFPVFSRRNREFAAETSSHVTAPSASEYQSSLQFRIWQKSHTKCGAMSAR